MKRGLSALASAALLGGSLFFGAGAAQAFTCPAGQHVISMGGVSDCMPDASGGGTGGAITYNGGGGGTAPAGQIQMPPQQPAPVWAPPANSVPQPVYHAPQAPAYNAPAPQAPAPAAQPYVPAAPSAPVAGAYRAPAAGQAPVFNAPGGAAVTQNGAGAWVDAATGAPVDAGVAAQAAAAAAAPAEAAPAAPAVVLPVNEVQAVEALRSATATPAEKDAALVIVKAKMDAVLDQAIGKALNSH